MADSVRESTTRVQDAERPRSRVKALESPAQQRVLQLQRTAGNRATCRALGIYRCKGKADARWADQAFKDRWTMRGPDEFYARVGPLLRNANAGNVQALQELEELLRGMNKTRHNRQYILDMIRVDATPSPGATHGSGLDELFQTASTAEWIERAMGVVAGTRPHSLFWIEAEHRWVSFNWIDAQQVVRVRTESVVWFFNKLLSGHSGAVRTPAGGSYQNFQPAFHRQRDQTERDASSPRNAVLRAIRRMLELTANEAAWFDPSNRFRGESAGGEDFTVPNERMAAWRALVDYRDQLKLAYVYFFNHSAEDPWLEQQQQPAPAGFGSTDPGSAALRLYPPSSPVEQPSSGATYAPMSPLHEPYPVVPPGNTVEFGRFMQRPIAWRRAGGPWVPSPRYQPPDVPAPPSPLDVMASLGPPQMTSSPQPSSASPQTSASPPSSVSPLMTSSSSYSSSSTSPPPLWSASPRMTTSSQPRFASSLEPSSESPRIISPPRPLGRPPASHAPSLSLSATARHLLQYAREKLRSGRQRIPPNDRDALASYLRWERRYLKSLEKLLGSLDYISFRVHVLVVDSLKAARARKLEELRADRKSTEAQ
jgi:hypothetical protein